MSSTSSTSDDTLLTLLLGVGAAMVIGPGLLAEHVPKAQQFLVDTNVLTRTNVLVPIGDGTGLDVPRVILGIAVVVLLGIGSVVLIRRRTDRRAAEKSRA